MLAKGTPTSTPAYEPGIRVLAIGDELVDGHTRDTNSVELMHALTDLGLRVLDMRQVRDSEAALMREAQALLDPASGVDLVISTGGLGPTVDDRTRQVLAGAFAAELVFDEERWQELEEWFRLRGREVDDIHRSQALHPVPGGHLHNEVGTADGLLFQSEGGLWIALPGVPSEMRHLLATGVLPLLAARFGHRRRGRVLSFRSHRLPEADLSRRLAPLDDLQALGDLGFYPSADGVLLRLSLPALPEAQLDRRENEARRLVRARMGTFLLAEDGRPVVELVHARLLELGQTLALAESCTGGGMARDLTGLPGASQVFPGGVVAYGNAVKLELLGVPLATIENWGTVSPACAAAMARGVRQRFRADWGLAVTGIAGPGGGTPEKPVGMVWLGVMGPQGEKTRLLNLHGNRGQIRARAVGQAWAWLLDQLMSVS